MFAAMLISPAYADAIAAIAVDTDYFCRHGATKDTDNL